MLESNLGGCLDILLVNFYIYNIQEFLKAYIENKIVAKKILVSQVYIFLKSNY